MTGIRKRALGRWWPAPMGLLRFVARLIPAARPIADGFRWKPAGFRITQCVITEAMVYLVLESETD